MRRRTRWRALLCQHHVLLLGERMLTLNGRGHRVRRVGMSLSLCLLSHAVDVVVLRAIVATRGEMGMVGSLNTWTTRPGSGMSPQRRRATTTLVVQ